MRIRFVLIIISPVSVCYSVLQASRILTMMYGSLKILNYIWCLVTIIIVVVICLSSSIISAADVCI